MHLGYLQKVLPFSGHLFRRHLYMLRSAGAECFTKEVLGRTCFHGATLLWFHADAPARNKSDATRRRTRSTSHTMPTAPAERISSTSTRVVACFSGCQPARLPYNLGLLTNSGSSFFAGPVTFSAAWQKKNDVMKWPFGGDFVLSL